MERGMDVQDSSAITGRGGLNRFIILHLGFRISGSLLVLAHLSKYQRKRKWKKVAGFNEGRPYVRSYTLKKS